MKRGYEGIAVGGSMLVVTFALIAAAEWRL